VDQYCWELVRALLDHEGAAEAATILDDALEQDGWDLPALVLLRAEADLRQGKQEPAMQRLRQLIEGQGTADVEKQVLVFAQERSLDAVIELILQRRVTRDLDKPEAAFELATFYRSRDRGTDATKVLQDYAHHARTPQEQAQRLNDAATFLAASGNDEEALRMQREAAQLSNGGREELVRLADLMAGSGQNSDAVAQLEAAFQKATSFDERADIDDRLYSLLMGEQKAQAPKKPAVSSNEFTLPSFITGAGFGSDEPASDSVVKMPGFAGPCGSCFAGSQGTAGHRDSAPAGHSVGQPGGAHVRGLRADEKRVHRPHDASASGAASRSGTPVAGGGAGR